MDNKTSTLPENVSKLDWAKKVKVVRTLSTFLDSDAMVFSHKAVYTSFKLWKILTKICSIYLTSTQHLLIFRIFNKDYDSNHQVSPWGPTVFLMNPQSCCSLDRMDKCVGGDPNTFERVRFVALFLSILTYLKHLAWLKIVHICWKLG